MEPNSVSLSAWNIITLALSTGVITAVINQAIGWTRDHFKERSSTNRDATYLAARLAVILESFAINCAESIADNDFYAQSKPYAGTQHVKLPDLAEYPSAADWKTLEPKLLARVLSLRNEVHLSDRAIGFWEEIDRECIPQACDEECGKCGYIAWELACDLRRKYRLPEYDPKRTSWDVVKLLREHHTKALNSVKQRVDSNVVEKAS